MSFLTALYTVLIKPLELIFEIIFSISNRIVHHPGLAIIFLSLAMNFLVLPLYKRADAMQEEERKTEEKIGPWQEKIKKTFKGDERFMMLQAFYRENNYKPTDALKGSLSLMLEIPFFIAAYRMLSSLKLLQGVKFGPIADLGAPDHMIVIGALAINLLPILMTLINIISSAIYTKGLPTKAKVQLYGMALIFLVFLYNSPAGLVFYWTLNNLFSLVKNIFYKLKNPKLVLSVMAALAGLAVALYTIICSSSMYSHRIVKLLIFAAALLIPIVLYFLKGKMKTKERAAFTPDKKVFFFGCTYIMALTGLLIPSALLASSPTEFVTQYLFFDPNYYLWFSALTAAGLFMVWMGFFYILANDTGKHIMGIVAFALAGVFTADYMFFGTKLGSVSNNLQYEVKPEYSAKTQLINLLVVVLVAAVFVVIFKFWKKGVPLILLTATLAIVGMSIVNMNKVSKGYMKVDYYVQEEDPVITLSKDGKNVIVLMLDRGIGTLVPYLLAQNPELETQFDGFTYYPNTVATGIRTNFAMPALTGGYEYTAGAMNRRDDMLLKDKTDEALLVMPVLFYENGYDITVCQPTLAGYSWDPDLSIYDDYPDFNLYITKGYFNEYNELLSGEEKALKERNMFLYSLFKVSPCLIQGTVYNEGLYNDADLNAGIMHVNEDGTELSVMQTTDGLYRASGLNNRYMNEYSVLTNMINMTQISDDPEGNFLFMTNDACHEPTLLQLPDYTPQMNVDNSAYIMNPEDYTIDGVNLEMDNVDQVAHFHVNMSTFMLLGDWFDYLREQGVYDNTRIIIVGDHGRDVHQIEQLEISSVGIDAEFANPVLLVKDFDSEGFVTDDTFMTNADVPTIALSGIVEDPVNPFTGNPINSDPKFEGPIEVIYSDYYDIDVNNGNVFMPGFWYSVHDDIYDENNWEYLGFY
ncbi:MAG: membrane protein insertase YidC [Clostridiales bacterium]|nr:membrane protein insertase YidC [Clostridiales bacterium]